MNKNKNKKMISEYYYEIPREIHDLKQMVEESCEIYADCPAFWVKKYRGGEFLPIKYSLLGHDVKALGTKLVEMGLKGRNIGIIGSGCYEWVVSYLAVTTGTGFAVPMDKELESDAIQNLVNRAECDTLIYTSDIADKAEKIKGLKYSIEMEYYGDRTDFNEPLIYEEKDGVISWKRLVGEGESLLKDGNRDFLDATVSPEDMAAIIFTSGTTGTPKGVMLSHRNITSNIMDLYRLGGLTTDRRNLNVLPIHHMLASACCLTFIYSGASTAFFEGLKYIVKNMAEIRVSFFVIVPLVAEMIYNRIWKEAKKTGKDKTLRRAIAANNRLRRVGLNAGGLLFKSVTDKFGGSLDTIVTAASAISPAVMRGFEDLGITFVQAYGLTETSPLAAATPLPANAERYRKAGSTGPCTPSGELKIVDPDEDGIGEIWYKGPNVMMGYYKMPEETSSVREGEWFKTGDLGFLDKDGWLYVTGRKKNVIVTKNGENIYPEEIEFVINSNPYIKDCMVYEAKRSDGDIVAVQVIPDEENILSDKGKSLSEEEMSAFMQDIIKDINVTLPNYKRIRSVIVRKDDFVRTTTKKIIRKENV